MALAQLNFTTSTEPVSASKDADPRQRESQPANLKYVAAPTGDRHLRIRPLSELLPKVPHSTNHRVHPLLLMQNVLVARGIHRAFEQEMHGARDLSHEQRPGRRRDGDLRWGQATLANWTNAAPEHTTVIVSRDGP